MTIKNNQLEDAPRQLTASPSAPNPASGKGTFYTKDVSGITEGFYIDSNGAEIQITTNGAINFIGAGEVNTASNVGVGTGGIFKQKTGVDLELRTLKAGTNITIVENADDVEISGPPSTGEANTASNVGAGNEVFKQKTGIDLEFRTVIAGTNMSIVSAADTITLNATGGGGGSSIEVQDEGISLTTAVTKFNFVGAGVTATEPVADEITVTVAAPGETNTASNVGAGGIAIFKQKTGINLEFKNLQLGEGISITQDVPNNEIDISVDVNSLTTEASLDGANDFVMVYDTSAGGHRKTLLNNLPSGGGGEANTASNQGSGSGIFKQKTGIDIELRSVIGGEGLSQTQNTDDVTIDLDVNNLSVEAASVSGDFYMFYDTSAGTHKKIDHDNMPGGGGGSSITVQDEGISLTTAVTKFNFAGAGVTVTEPIADEMLVTIAGGGASIPVEDEGGSITTGVTKFNFVGAGVTATNSVDDVTITIPGGSGSQLGDDFRITLEPAASITARIADGSSVIPGALTLYQGDNGSVDANLGATANDLVIEYLTGGLPVIVTVMAQVAPLFFVTKRIDTNHTLNDRVVSNIGKTQFKISVLQTDVSVLDRVEIYIKLTS